MKHKKIISISIFILLVTGIIISCSDSGESSASNSNSASNCPTKTCADFSTQSQAQATYDSNRSCYKKLDGDGNGKACESLPK